jgi:general secretion pathway protein B
LPEPARPPAVRNEVQPKGSGDNIVISGIAWQEEHALRRAVVNGALLGEGAEVLGATVVEIREKSIRFKRDGDSFEIPYANP